MASYVKPQLFVSSFDCPSQKEAATHVWADLFTYSSDWPLWIKRTTLPPLNAELVTQKGHVCKRVEMQTYTDVRANTHTHTYTRARLDAQTRALTFFASVNKTLEFLRKISLFQLTLRTTSNYHTHTHKLHIHTQTHARTRTHTPERRLCFSQKKKKNSEFIQRNKSILNNINNNIPHSLFAPKLNAGTRFTLHLRYLNFMCTCMRSCVHCMRQE